MPVQGLSSLGLLHFFEGMYDERMAKNQQPLNERYLKAKKRFTTLPAKPYPTTLTNKGLPPGQYEVPSMVAMPPITLRYPHVSKEQWSLRVYGEVAKEIKWNWDEFLKFPQQEFRIDFHCVTRWSKFDQVFVGVPFAAIVEAVQPTKQAQFVIFECNDGYTTNVPFAELNENVCFIATSMNGKEIPDRYGGPVRAVIPHLYGWKSAKFLSAIRFQANDEPGFWEVRGYHNHADPWTEERFS